METSEEQILQETTATEISAAISSAKSYNPGLKALLSIKKYTATLEKAYIEMLQTENELLGLNKNGLLMIEANTSSDEIVRYKSVLHEINQAVTAINEIITAAKDKVPQKDKEGYYAMWQQLNAHISELQNHSKHAADSGFATLPGAMHSEWEKEIVNPGSELIESLVEKVESCRVLLQVIERYTPDELNSLTKIIVDHVPADFTYEEAKEYQNDYYKALVNFKNEFKKDKNLWDKFLDILAGGTHQLPSEGAMMERWLDGEEAEP